jgi:hypothetical protein
MKCRLLLYVFVLYGFDIISTSILAYVAVLPRCLSNVARELETLFARAMGGYMVCPIWMLLVRTYRPVRFELTDPRAHRDSIWKLRRPAGATRRMECASFCWRA